MAAMSTSNCVSMHATAVTVQLLHVSLYAEDLMFSALTQPSYIGVLTLLKDFADANILGLATLIKDRSYVNWVKDDGIFRPLTWDTIRDRGFWKVEQIVQALLMIVRQYSTSGLFRGEMKTEAVGWIDTVESMQMDIYKDLSKDIDTEGMSIQTWQNVKHQL